MFLTHTIAHYFYPRHSNNHKARVLHTSGIFVLIISLLFFQLILQLFPLAGVKILGYAANIPSSKVVSLTNEERTRAGLSSLEYNPLLEAAAKAKGEHMLANNYWSHVAPDGTEPWFFFTDTGYKYRYAGENLARDFSNAESALSAWIASPSHKENLLSTKYREIGVAVVEGELEGVETTIIVQLFGTRLTDTVPELSLAEAKSDEVLVIPTSSPTSSFVALTPTPIALTAQISPSPSITQENIIAAAEPVHEEAKGIGVLISPFTTTKNISLAIIVLLLIILVVDGVVVSRRNISRIGGRTFAHLAFLGMILALVLIARAGEIL